MWLLHAAVWAILVDLCYSFNQWPPSSMLNRQMSEHENSGSVRMRHKVLRTAEIFPSRAAALLPLWSTNKLSDIGPTADPPKNKKSTVKPAAKRRFSPKYKKASGKSFVKRGESRGRSSSGKGNDKSEDDNSETGGFETWRLFNIEIPLDSDEGKDNIEVQGSLLAAVCRVLRCKEDDIAASDVKIMRKSFDSRKRNQSQLKFVYTVDVTFNRKKLKSRIYPVEGKFERLDGANTEHWQIAQQPAASGARSQNVVIVGAGPAGLFAAYTLCMAGIKPIIIERGQPVG